MSSACSRLSTVAIRRERAHGFPTMGGGSMVPVSSLILSPGPERRCQPPTAEGGNQGNRIDFLRLF